MKWWGYLIFVIENYLYVYGVGYILYVLVCKFYVDFVKVFVIGIFYDLGGVVLVDERVIVVEFIGISLNDEECEVLLLVYVKLGKYFV